MPVRGESRPGVISAQAADGGVAQGRGVKGRVAPTRQDTVELIRFPYALSQELRETSSNDALEPGDGVRPLPHAQDIARAQHPTGRLSAVPAELSVPLGDGEMTDA